jgi:hypothetical protein
VFDAALRELPGVGAHALAPENLVARVEQDDADVGPEAFPVEHNQPQILTGFIIAPACAARILANPHALFRAFAAALQLSPGTPHAPARW